MSEFMDFVDWSIVGPALAVLVLIGMSAFFSGSETALTAASRARMHSLENDGNKRAKAVNQLRMQKTKLIGALLLGNNLVNILASAIATAVFIRVVGEGGVFYATILMTLLVLIFAEVLPKTYALHFADKMAMAIAPFVKVIVLVFGPVTEVVSRIVAGVLRLFGVDAENGISDDTEEELRGAIDLHRGTTSEHDEQRAMLRSILDLANVDVGDIMTHRRNVIMVDTQNPISQVVQDVLESPFTRMPLCKDGPDNIVGVLHAKNLLRALQANKGDVDKLSIEEIAMAPWFIPDTTSLYDQLQAFRQRRAHFACVVDEYGSFMGIVTLEDILEEIVGEIDDEVDTETMEGVRAQADGGYLVDGTVTIRDLNRAFEWRLPDEDYATLAGLILHETKMIPDVGQAFSFYGFRFYIVRKHRHQITQIRLYPPLEVDSDDEA